MTRRSLLLTACFLPGLRGARAQAPAPAAFPTATAGGFRYRDPRLPDLPQREWSVYVPRDPRRLLGPSRDPKSNAFYPHRVHVLCSSGTGAAVRFVVHYLTPEDEALARRAGGLLARLYWVARDYLGRGLQGNRFVDLWLSRAGEAGGEEFEGNLYLFAVHEPRAAAEWVRELAHEYGHLVVPPVGEYTAPEKWANGYLGERLFMKWLLADNGQTDTWDRPIDGAAFVDRQVRPLVERFLDAGPDAHAGRRQDAAGMQHFIGQALAAEAAFGPEVLGRALASLAGTRPEDFNRALGGALAAARRYTLEPAAFIPARSRREAGAELAFHRAAYWLYVPPGPARVAVEGRIPTGTAASLDAAELRPATPLGSEAAAWVVTPHGSAGTWRRLELSAQTGAFTLERVLLKLRD